MAKRREAGDGGRAKREMKRERTSQLCERDRLAKTTLWGSHLLPVRLALAYDEKLNGESSPEADEADCDTLQSLDIHEVGNEPDDGDEDGEAGRPASKVSS